MTNKSTCTESTSSTTMSVSNVNTITVPSKVIVEFPFEEAPHPISDEDEGPMTMLSPLSAILDELTSTCDCSSSVSTVPSIGPTAFLNTYPSGSPIPSQRPVFEFTIPSDSIDSSFDDPVPPLSPMSFSDVVMSSNSSNECTDEGVEAFVPNSPTSTLDVRLILTTDDQRKEIVKPKLSSSANLLHRQAFAQNYFAMKQTYLADEISLDMECSDWSDEEEYFDDNEQTQYASSRHNFGEEPLGLSFLEEENTTEQRRKWST